MADGPPFEQPGFTSPMLLALDTGGPSTSVAIFRGRVLAEVVWQSARRESAQVLTVIETALQLARVEKGAVDVLAVASGPGSYSGLRVGLATATGLALSLNIGIAQVPTLDCLAWGISGPPAPVRAAVSVGRGRFASARFKRDALDVHQETSIEPMELDELTESAAAEGSVLVVDLDAAARRRLEVEFGERVKLAGAAVSARRAGTLAEVAALRLARGQISPGLTVEPIYLGEAGANR